MTSMSRLLLSLAAVAVCTTVHAAPFDSADQARRDRNREEVLAKHDLGTASSSRYEAAPQAQQKTLKSESKRAVDATKSFGHRSAERMREFGARVNASVKGQPAPATDPYNHGPQ